jgi:hypothetical protein
MNIILGDYLRAILNLNRNPIHSDWKLDPRDDFVDVFNREGTPVGIGNQVSIEFNLIYRWHSAISQSDEKWLNIMLRKVMEDSKEEMIKKKSNPGESAGTWRAWMGVLS